MVTNNNYILKRNDLLYPELSYKINGVLFEVFREIGGGHLEKYYQKAVAKVLHDMGILYEEQYYVPLMCKNEIVGKYFLDFLIEGKIILELKRGKFVPGHVIDQTKRYLSSLNLELALIACFTSEGVFTKRIVNLY